MCEHSPLQFLVPFSPIPFLLLSPAQLSFRSPAALKDAVICLFLEDAVTRGSTTIEQRIGCSSRAVGSGGKWGKTAPRRQDAALTPNPSPVAHPQHSPICRHSSEGWITLISAVFPLLFSWMSLFQAWEE